MLLGVPRETKVHEYRVGLTPESVKALVGRGHAVLVERGAGAGVGASDAEYAAAGALVAERPEEVFARSELIVKVKEPLPAERAWLRPGQCIFAYLHLAPDPEQAADLVKSGAIAIAYETVTSPAGGLPLLAPMSAVAGRMAVHVAAHFLERPSGGRGVLLPGVRGVPAAKLVVLGAGVVGANAVEVAAGMGADVTVLNRSEGPLRRLSREHGARLKASIATPATIGRELRDADAVIGAALVPGARTPRLVSREMVRGMKAGAVVVDVAIDQGGCFETSRPTTHAAPVYEEEGIVHYCVTNMPGAVPRTSTYALNGATLPFVLDLADRGIAQALARDAHLREGLSVCRGRVTRRELADALGAAFSEPLAALAD